LRIKRRHRLKTREVRRLISDVASIPSLKGKSDLDEDALVEVVEYQRGGVLYLVKGEPSYARVKNNLIPVLTNTTLIDGIPKVTVDMGAVPHICNGADIMAPGVVRVSDDFEKGTLVAVVDEQHGKSISVGRTLVDSKDMRRARRGKVIENLHYVGDQLWDALKECC